MRGSLEGDYEVVMGSCRSLRNEGYSPLNPKGEASRHLEHRYWRCQEASFFRKQRTGPEHPVGFSRWPAGASLKFRPGAPIVFQLDLKPRRRKWAAVGAVPMLGVAVAAAAASSSERVWP